MRNRSTGQCDTCLNNKREKKSTLKVAYLNSYESKGSRVVRNEDDGVVALVSRMTVSLGADWHRPHLCGAGPKWSGSRLVTSKGHGVGCFWSTLPVARSASRDHKGARVAIPFRAATELSDRGAPSRESPTKDKRDARIEQPANQLATAT